MKIPGVEPEDIHVVGLQAFEGAFERLDHILAVVAGGVGVAVLPVLGVFGGEDEGVAFVGDEFAEEGFGLAFGVVVGGVEEVAAGVEVGVEDLAAFGFGCAPGDGFAEGHGAQAEFGDAQAAFAE